MAIIILSLCSFTSLSSAETDFGVFDEDFWFVEGPSNQYIETFDGWNFTIEAVREYTLEGIIISRQNYSVANASEKPIDIFSPVDVFMGTEKIAENVDNYTFKVERWEYREVFWWVSGYELYFRKHVGNNHLIPHNLPAYQSILELNEGDIVRINGTLVNLDGNNGDSEYHWYTDTKIGNEECEIILVENITVLRAYDDGSQGLGTYELAGILGIGIGLSTVGTVVVVRKKNLEI